APLLSPRRDPLHVALDRLERSRAELLFVELDKPLLGRAEERRVLAAPAVWVRVVKRARRDEHPDRSEMVDDPGIRLPDREAGEVLHARDEAAVVVHRVEDREAERSAELVVLLAVAGRDVDEARALVHRHEVRRRDRALAVDPRMPERVADETLALKESERVVRGRLEERKKLVHPRPSNDVDLSRQRERLVALRRVD